MEPAILIPVAVAIVAPLGAYLLAARRMSGKVQTSDAGELWAESRAIRDDYRNRLLDAADRSRDLEARVAKLENSNNELNRENFALQNKVLALERLVTELRDTITKLQATIQTQAQELGKEKRLNGH
jgi:chromosome segregation ATPase